MKNLTINLKHQDASQKLKDSLRTISGNTLRVLSEVDMYGDNSEAEAETKFTKPYNETIMKRINVWIVLLSFACFIHSACAESENGSKVGSKPPEISSLKLLQAPAEARTSWAELKGKVIVLEFWATWCGPCVAAIPHMNELTEKFKDKAVQFIAITGEDETTVQKFLKKKPISGWVGVDGDKSVHKAYGVTEIPYTVIIDQQGHIADVTYPLAVTEQRLNDLLDGKKIASVERPKEYQVRAGELPERIPDGKPPLYQVIIRPTQNSNGDSESIGGNGGLTALGSSLSDVLSTVYPFLDCRIVTDSPLPEGRFDFVAKAPDESDETRNILLRQAIQVTFGITAAVETREMDVFILTLKRINAPGLVRSVTEGSFSSSGPGKIQGINMPINALRQELERWLGKPVVDETELKEGFDINLKWAQPDSIRNPEALIRAVQEQLGLELTQANRRIEVLVVESRNSNKK